MLAAALQAGAEAYIGRFADERNENGRQPVVRNGSAQARTLLTSAARSRSPLYLVGAGSSVLVRQHAGTGVDPPDEHAGSAT